MRDLQLKISRKSVVLFGLFASFTTFMYWFTFSTHSKTVPFGLFSHVETERRYKSGFENDIQYFNKICTGVDIATKTEITSVKLSKMDVYVSKDYSSVFVKLNAYNNKNVTKTRGGDLIFVFAQQTHGDGKLAIQMVDHSNGTYSGQIAIPWTGKTKVRSKIATKLENTCLRLKTMQSYGSSVHCMTQVWGFEGVFTKNNHMEKTLCLPDERIVGYEHVCNFSGINDGFPWYCGRPGSTSLGCENIKFFHTAPFGSWRGINASVKVDVTSGEIEHGNAVIDVKDTNKIENVNKIKCIDLERSETWENITDRINGYWLNNSWHFPVCQTTLEHTLDQYKRCLAGRHLYFFGDSTARQYADYFVNEVLETRPKIDLRLYMFGNNEYNWINTFTNFNINVTFLKHALPFSGDDFPINGITSVFTELLRLSKGNISGEKFIIFIVFHAHFQSFPISIYCQRIRRLVETIKIFLSLKPNAQFFLKSPSYVSDQGNRWVENKFSLVYISILKEEFRELHDKVVYLDTWSINVVHETISIHPEITTLLHQIRHFMSFIC